MAGRLLHFKAPHGPQLSLQRAGTSSYGALTKCCMQQVSAAPTIKAQSKLHALQESRGAVKTPMCSAKPARPGGHTNLFPHFLEPRAHPSGSCTNQHSHTNQHFSTNRQFSTSQHSRWVRDNPKMRGATAMAKTQDTSIEITCETNASSGLQRKSADGEEGFTMEEAIDALGFGRFQALLLGYTGMAWVAEAMEMMLLSFVGPAVKTEWDLHGWQEGAISSVVFIGMLIGAYSWGVLSDQRGRRFGFFATAVLTLFAGLASAVAPSYPVLLATRFLVGVGLGGGPTVFSLFTEFLPTSDRGFWLVGINMFWTLGSVVEASLAWAVLPTLGWRWLLAISAIPLGVLLLAYPLLPESPRFLLGVKGDAVEARKVLERVAKSNGRSLPPGELVLRNAEAQPLAEKGKEGGALPAAALDAGRDDPDARRSAHDQRGAHSPGNRNPLDGLRSVVAPLFAPALRNTTLVLWAVFFGNAFTYYGLVLLTSQLAGGGECGGGAAAAAAAASAASDSVYREVFVTSLAELPGLLVAAFILDRIGRKLSMQSLFTLTGLFLLPLVFNHSDETVTTALLFCARASIMGAFASLYIYAPEFYPTSVRSTGLGLASSFSRLGGFFCPLVAVDLVSNCHIDIAVSLFVAIPLGAAFAVSLLSVETTGRALSDDV